MRTKLAVVVAGVGLVVMVAGVRVVAHHAFAAEFDANKPLTLEGTVTKMEWINPHAWIHIDVTKEDGTVEQWMIEGGTPNTLLRRGFSKNSILPGNGDRRLRVSGQGWVDEGQRPESHVSRWVAAVSRLRGHGRSD